MSQVVLYILTEVARKLRQLLLPPGPGEIPKSAQKRKADSDVDSNLGEPLAKREAFGRARFPTLVNVSGFGQCIAVLTSGGDAQGKARYTLCLAAFIVF